MAKKKAKKVKSKHSARPIVAGYLEKINSRIFDQFKSQIIDLIKGNQGVYALYRREKLYYIGLATDFKTRVNQHLKDRHKGKWNYFSLYIIRKQDHIRELEALLLRIAGPTGNYQQGKLKRAKNLRPKLKRMLTEDVRKVIEEILGTTKPKTKRVRPKSITRKTKTRKAAARPLKGFFPGGKRLRATYKANHYKAWVYAGGSIRFNGQLYASPSAAGKAARGKATNGWVFWKYWNDSGQLVPLSAARS